MKNTTTENKYFKRVKEKAKTVIGSNEKLSRLIKQSQQKLLGISNSKLIANAKVFIRMIRAYITGSYREIPVKSILYLAAALLYFVMPIDLIADFIPVTGFIDDFAVILWVYKQIEKDVESFINWESDTSNFQS